MYIVTSNAKEAIKVTDKSRADYFRERRKKTSAFYAEVDTDKLKRLQERLTEQQKSKKKWLDEKIDEELNK